MAEKLPFKVQKGCLVPAGNWCAEKLGARKYSIGDIVFAVIRKPRNPRFNSLVHAGFARLLIENIEAFQYMEEHDVLKRLQIEGRIGCEEIGVDLPGIGPCVQFVPKSLSFESMGEEEFSKIFKNFCRYVAERYWPDMTPEEVENLSKVMEQE